MLLDTMCNAFGGIILLAVLVTLLTSKERGSQTSASPESSEMVQRRLALAQANLKHALELSASLQNKADDPRWKQQLDSLATRKQLQQALQQTRQAVDESTKALESANASEPTERLRFLNAQLNAAEAKNVELRNSLTAAQENAKRLKHRLDSLHEQVATLVNNAQRPLRLPKEHETGKRAFYVIVEYGQVFPCRNADLTRNATSISWSSRGESETARPIAGQGYAVADGAKLRALFNGIPKDLVYVAFCVFEDSFAEFNRAKEMATASGLVYGWEPFRKEDGPVSFGPIGHTPKPQ